MLLRRKSTADDEYHHADTVGVYGVITGANGAVMSSSVYDAFIAPQYVQGGADTQMTARHGLKAAEPLTFIFHYPAQLMLSTHFLTLFTACIALCRLYQMNACWSAKHHYLSS